MVFVARSPDALVEGRGWHIIDRYIHPQAPQTATKGPSRRARAIFKLGQKHTTARPISSRMTTSICPQLNTVSWLGSTPSSCNSGAITSRKTSTSSASRCSKASCPGLVLAEVGFDTSDEVDQPIELPPWFAVEMSDDVRFTGGALASLESGQAVDLIRAMGGDRHKPACIATTTGSQSPEPARSKESEIRVTGP